jgi:hypothetical protein
MELFAEILVVDGSSVAAEEACVKILKFRFQNGPTPFKSANSPLKANTR